MIFVIPLKLILKRKIGYFKYNKSRAFLFILGNRVLLFSYYNSQKMSERQIYY